jgi:hypothetical protein
MKTLVIKRDDRQYQCDVTGGDFFGEATVIIKEIIHPDRKFLRTEVLGYTKTINLDAYVSILAGVEKAVDKYHAEKTREERIKKMWKEFEEKA